jgi:hypothetical protein
MAVHGVIPPPERELASTLIARPAYEGGSIVNLMASIVAACGGEPRYAALEGLDAHRLRNARHIVLVVVDGLGFEFLRSSRPGSALRRNLSRSITSVFPPTTATAITTFLTGMAPQQHGLTGWFMYFEEIGTVVSILPFETRDGGIPLRARGVRAGRLLGHTAVFDRIPRASASVSPARIAHSEFNRSHTGRAALRPYETLPQFIDAIEAAVSGSDDPSFVYAYWPDLDHLAHLEGIGSRACEAHLGALDAAYEELLARLSRTGALLLVTADHGFVDVPPQNVVRLADHPEFAAMLALPLCGEPRTAYCYVAPAHGRAFAAYVEAELADRAVCIESEALVEGGYFGPGSRHPRLLERLGRYTLLLRDGCAIQDELPGERRPRFVGVHGGGSAAEMLVPLIVAEA